MAWTVTSLLVCRLRTTGIRWRVAAKKTFLTEAHRQARLQWAYEHQATPVEEWRSVVFTDESSHRSDQCRSKRVWRMANTWHPVRLHSVI